MDIKLHTKIKHRILSYYYGALKKVIKNFYYWFYVDLYAGDGICNCINIPEHILPMLSDQSDKTFPPSFFNLFKYAKELENTKLKITFIFNDLYEIDKLKQKLPKDIPNIVTGNKDANAYYKDALKLIEKPERPSLFYLDPTNHKDLKFSTIKEISEFKSKDRRPELIINLMIFSMLEAVKRKEYETITESLGTDAWLKELPKYHSQNKTHELFKNIFVKQMNNLGYKTTEYLVTSTEKKAPQYYLIFCACNDQIYKIHKNIEPNIRKLQNEDWVKETAIIAYQIHKVPTMQKTLSGF